MKYNQDYKLRDKMLNIDESTECGGTWRFEGCTAETLESLIDLGFADPDEYQNSAPTIGEILEFLKENPNYTAHGYVVSIDRDDYRVSVEGVEGHEYDTEQIANFVTLFRFADEFFVNKDYQRAWFD